MTTANRDFASCIPMYGLGPGYGTHGGGLPERSTSAPLLAAIRAYRAEHDCAPSLNWVARTAQAQTGMMLCRERAERAIQEAGL